MTGDNIRVSKVTATYSDLDVTEKHWPNLRRPVIGARSICLEPSDKTIVADDFDSDQDTDESPPKSSIEKRDNAWPTG